MFTLLCLLSCEPSKKDLIENLTTNGEEIRELKSFFNSIVPKEYSVYIEFENNEKIDLWVYDVVNKNRAGGDVVLFQQWRINPYDYKEELPTRYDSIEYAPKTKNLEIVKQKLQWTDDTFREIKTMLDKANCISVKSGDPAEIGFARRGLGEYSYLIFDKPIPDNLKTEYNDGYTNILYNDTVVLVWGAGVLGLQHFPD
jgi:hypothetical protein